MPVFRLILVCHKVAAVGPVEFDLPQFLVVRTRKPIVQVVQPFQALVGNLVRLLENQIVNQMSRVEPLFLHGGKPIGAKPLPSTQLRKNNAGNWRADRARRRNQAPPGASEPAKS